MPSTNSVPRETSCTGMTTSRTITDHVPRETITRAHAHDKTKTKNIHAHAARPGRPPRPRPRTRNRPHSPQHTTRPDEHRVSLSPWISFLFTSYPPPPPRWGGGYRSPAPLPTADHASPRWRSPSSPTTGGRLTPSTPGGPLRRARAPTCPRARSRARAKPTLRVGAIVSTSPATPTTRWRSQTGPTRRAGTVTPTVPLAIRSRFVAGRSRPSAHRARPPAMTRSPA